MLFPYEWFPVLALLVGTVFALLFFWLGVWHGRSTPKVCLPRRPTRCPWCGGQLRSELVWSSVCRACNRGQVGGFRPGDLRDPEHPPAFVSRVDVKGDRRP